MSNIYARSTDAELRHFAKERKLTVIIMSGRRKKPNRADHIAALEEADEDKVSPFFKLSAELRNVIYKLLIDTGDLCTCQPTIMSVCRQTYYEAADILYKAHSFDIGIHGNAIMSHGVPCGDYSPIQASYVGGQPGRDITTLLWPPFIRKARMVRLKFVFPTRNCWRPFNSHALDGDEFTKERVYADSHGCPPGYFHSGFFSILNNVLYSLCSTLTTSKHIRTFELDLSALNMGDDDRAVLSATCDCLQLAVEPLTMLKRLDRVAITGSWPGVIALMEASIKKPLTWRAEGGSILDRYRRSLRKAEVLLELVYKEQRVAGLRTYQVRHITRHLDRVAKQHDGLRRLVCPGNTMFVNNDWEGALIWEGDRLVQLVQEVDINRMRVQLEEAQEKAREDFEEYQALLDKFGSV